ncbi:outer membrane beta-barrel protein [Vibrio bivalvicida]|uniref:Outer membrane beta-barrel protein n=1 Tax=Vibrio bivalvicida TaxID=1276888 RepID=A0ABV4MN44_9VIBR
MKKVTVLTSAITSLLLVSPATFAKTYVGLELGGGKFSTSMTSQNLDQEATDDYSKMVNEMDSAGYIRLQAGQYLNQNVRVYGYVQRDADNKVEFSEFDLDDGVVEKNDLERNSYQLGLGADYMYFLTNDWFVVGGGTLGYYNSKLKLTEFENGAQTGSIESKKSGLSAGLNLGTGYNFTESFTAEVGLRHTQLFGNEHKLSSDEGGSITAKFDSSTQFYINASYSF